MLDNVALSTSPPMSKDTRKVSLPLRMVRLGVGSGTISFFLGYHEYLKV
jgi:hypothetical protein